MHPRLVLVDSVEHQCASTPHVVDALISQLLHTGCFYDDVEPVWVVILELLPLRLGVLPVELDVLVTGVKVLGDIHLDALVRGDDDAGGAVKFEELCEDQTGGSSTEEENFDSDRGVKLVESVDGTCGRFKEGGILVTEVMDFVELLLLAGNATKSD